jgi:hypothetical protein
MHRPKQRFLSAVAKKETSYEPKYEEIGTAYILDSMDKGFN